MNEKEMKELCLLIEKIVNVDCRKSTLKRIDSFIGNDTDNLNRMSNFILSAVLSKCSELDNECNTLVSKNIDSKGIRSLPIADTTDFLNNIQATGTLCMILKRIIETLYNKNAIPTIEQKQATLH